MRHSESENPSDTSTPKQFVLKIDAGLPERRLLEEIGGLSFDELAAAVLDWNQHSMEHPHDQFS